MVYSHGSEDLRPQPEEDTTPLSQRLLEIDAERKSQNVGKMDVWFAVGNACHNRD